MNDLAKLKLSLICLFFFKPAILSDGVLLNNLEATSEILPNIKEDIKKLKSEAFFPFFLYDLPPTGNQKKHFVTCCLLQNKGWLYFFDSAQLCRLK